MMESLFLKNFQGHRMLRVKLDPQVTTIVGPTDSGKSSIIRAFQWLALNEPRGTDFVREGTTKATVVLRIDGRKLKRIRGKRGAYFLDGQKFAAFGARVPDEVLALLNLGMINFQGQHDAAYWFSQSPGYVSRQLNQIVDLGVIDTTLANLADMLRSTRAEARVVDDRLRAAKKERATLKPAKEAAKDLVRVEKLEAKSEHEAERRRTLQALVDAAVTLRTRRDNLKNAVSAGTLVVSAGDAWLCKAQHTTNLGAALLEAVTARHKVGKRPPDPLVTGDQAKHYQEQRDKRVRLETYVKAAKVHVKMRAVALEAVDDAHDELKQFDGQECPLCEQKVTIWPLTPF